MAAQGSSNVTHIRSSPERTRCHRQVSPSMARPWAIMFREAEAAQCKAACRAFMRVPDIIMSGRRLAEKVRALVAVFSRQAVRASMGPWRASRSKRAIAVGNRIQVFVSDGGRGHERRLSDASVRIKSLGSAFAGDRERRIWRRRGWRQHTQQCADRAGRAIEETEDGPPRRVVKWIGNGGRWGPCETVEELELQIYGSKRSWI